MKIVEWVKDHKKAIIFGGVAIVAGVAGYRVLDEIVFDFPVRKATGNGMVYNEFDRKTIGISLIQPDRTLGKIRFCGRRTSLELSREEATKFANNILDVVENEVDGIQISHF